jgi:DNA polymerase-3 subunit delta
MIYLIHGEEEFLRSRRLATIRKQAGPPDPVELNTIELSGDRVTLGELQSAADAVPFLCERRLVIVYNGLRRLSSEPAEMEKLLSYLVRMPPTTELIFLEEQRLDPRHPILRFLLDREQVGQAHVYLCLAPTPRELPQWVKDHARSKGIVLSPEAATALADAIGPNLRLIDVELDKLIAYVSPRQRVEETDVHTVVPDAQAGNVFHLVDAIAERRAGQAFTLLHRLRDAGSPAPYLITMIQRQFRILLQVSELMHAAVPFDEIVSRLSLRDFMVRRAQQQVRHWTSSELVDAFQLLLAADWAMKTGQLDEDTALDLLLVALILRTKPGSCQALRRHVAASAKL